MRTSTMRCWISWSALILLAGSGMDSGVAFGQTPMPSEAAAAVAPKVAGTLLLAGGGRLPDEIRQRFVELAGGAAARIVIIPADPNGDAPERLEATLAPWK